MAVQIGPLSARRNDEQALVAGRAGDPADLVLLAADGLDWHVMLTVEHCPVGRATRFWSGAVRFMTPSLSLERVEKDRYSQDINTGSRCARRDKKTPQRRKLRGSRASRSWRYGPRGGR
jgi:hypothetical protein